MPKKNPPQMDWVVCADERDWASAQSHPQDAPDVGAPRQKWPVKRLLWWGFPTAIMLVIGAVVGGWQLWQQAEEGIANVEAEIAESVAADLWKAGASGDFGRVSWQEQTFLKAMNLAAHGRNTLVGVDLRDLSDKWATVEVSIQPTTTAMVYLQTRLYHESDEGWLRAPVTVNKWGAVRSLESRYFVIRYRAVDEEAATDAAARIDALYLGLYASLYRGEPPPEKQVIIVDPAQLAGVLERLVSTSEEMIVTSPDSTLRPAAIKVGDLLLQSIMLALYNRIAAQAWSEYNLSTDGDNFLSGLRLWLIWDQELPLSVWREPLVRWLFSAAQNGVKQEHELPAFFSELCLHQALWMRSPEDIGIPLMCWQPNGSPPQLLSMLDNYPFESLSITWVAYTREQYSARDMPLYTSNEWPGYAPVALATAFEYIAATYGPDKIPQLLAVVSANHGAETVIPPVLGVSIADFDAGWRAFLLQRYGLTP